MHKAESQSIEDDIGGNHISNCANEATVEALLLYTHDHAFLYEHATKEIMVDYLRQVGNMSLLGLLQGMWKMER